MLWCCRVCDPLVGTGLRPTVCLQLCETWLASCRDDYFEWYREELLPCRYRKQAAVIAACLVC